MHCFNFIQYAIIASTFVKLSASKGQEPGQGQGQHESSKESDAPQHTSSSYPFTDDPVSDGPDNLTTIILVIGSLVLLLPILLHFVYRKWQKLKRANASALPRPEIETVRVLRQPLGPLPAESIRGQSSMRHAGFVLPVPANISVDTQTGFRLPVRANSPIGGFQLPLRVNSPVRDTQPPDYNSLQVDQKWEEFQDEIELPPPYNPQTMAPNYDTSIT